MPEGIKKIGLQIDIIVPGAPSAVKGFEGLRKSTDLLAKKMAQTGKQTKKLGVELKKVGSGVRAAAAATKAGVTANMGLAKTTRDAAQASAELGSRIKSFGSTLGDMRSRLKRAAGTTKEFLTRKRELGVVTTKADLSSKKYGNTLVKITKDEVVRGQSLKRFIVIYLQTALSIEAIKSSTVALAREFGELIQGSRDIAKTLRSIGAATGATDEELRIMRDVIDAVALASPKSAGEIAIMAEEFNRAGFSARETAQSLLVVNNASAKTGRSMDDLKDALLAAFKGDVEEASRTLLVNLKGLTDEQINQGGVLDILTAKYGTQLQNSLELEGSWATVKSVIGAAGLELAEQLEGSDELKVVVKETGLAFVAWLTSLVKSGKAVNFIRTALEVTYKFIQIMRSGFLTVQLVIEHIIESLLFFPNAMVHGFTEAVRLQEEALRNSPYLKALLEIDVSKPLIPAAGGADKSFEEALEAANAKFQAFLKALDDKNTRKVVNRQKETTKATKDGTEKISAKIDDLVHTVGQGFRDTQRALELSEKGTAIDAGFQSLDATRSREKLLGSLELKFPKKFEGNQEKILDAISDAVLELGENIAPGMEELQRIDLQLVENFKENARIEDDLLHVTQRLREESAERLVELRDSVGLQGKALEEAIKFEKRALEESTKQAQHSAALAQLDLKQQKGLLTRNREDVVNELGDLRDRQQEKLDEQIEEQKKAEADRKKAAKEALKEANDRFKRRIELENKRQAEIVKRLQDVIGAIGSLGVALINTIAAGAAGIQDPQELADEMQEAFEKSLPALDKTITDANQALAEAQQSRDEEALKESLARFDEIKATLERQGIGEEEVKQLRALGEMRDLLKEGRDFGKQNTSTFKEMRDQLLKSTEAFEALTGSNFGPNIEEKIVQQAEQSKQQANELIARLPDVGRDFAERLAAAQQGKSDAQRQLSAAQKAGDLGAGQAAQDAVAAAELELFDIQQEQAAFQTQVSKILSDLQQSGSQLGSAIQAVAERDPESSGVSDAAIQLVREFEELQKTIGEQAKRGDPEAEAAAQEALTEAMNARTEAEETYIGDLESSVGEITEANLELGRDAAKKTLTDFGTTVGEVFKPQIEETLKPAVSSALEVFGLSAKNVGAVTSSLTAGALQFAGPLIELFSQAPEKIEEFINVFIEGAVDIITRIIENLPTIAITLIVGIIRAIPRLIRALVSALPTLVQSLADDLPKITKAFVDFLVYDAPKIITELVKQAPKFISAMIDLFVNQFRAIGNAIRRVLGLGGGISSGRTSGGGGAGRAASIVQEAKRKIPKVPTFTAKNSSDEEIQLELPGLSVPSSTGSGGGRLTPSAEANKELADRIKSQQIASKRLTKELTLNSKEFRLNTKELKDSNKASSSGAGAGVDPAIQILLDILKAQEDANDLLREQNRNFATASAAFNPYADPTTANIGPSVPQEVIINIGQERLANVLLDLDQSGYRLSGVAI